MTTYQPMTSKNVQYQALNDLTNKRETIDLEVAELPAGTKIYEVMKANDSWVMIPGYDLYADGNGGLTIVYNH